MAVPCLFLLTRRSLPRAWPRIFSPSRRPSSLGRKRMPVRSPPSGRTEFYLAPLRAPLGPRVPFESLSACEAAYDAIRSVVRRKSTPEAERIALTHPFALALGQFFIEHRGYALVGQKTYAGYNPRYDIFLLTKRHNQDRRNL
jgi:hypothetical protein